MKVSNVVASAVVFVIALLVVGAVLVWAPPCSGTLELTNGNMMPMRCVYTGKIALLIAALLAVVSLVSLVTKRPAPVAMVTLSMALVLLTFETPLSIGVCKADGMACGVTALWLRACGGTAAVSTIVGAFVGSTHKYVKD